MEAGPDPGETRKICVLTAGAQGNRVSGLYPFYRLLARHWSTFLLSYSTDGSIYGPFEGRFGRVVLGPAPMPPLVYMLDFLMRIRGDLVICFQYDPWALFAALLASKIRRIPLCLLAQDWDLGLAPAYRLREIHRLYSLRHEAYYRLAERLATRHCDLIIASTVFLARRLGGRLVLPQGFADEVGGRREEARREIGADAEDIVVMWAGMPRPWKGLEGLVYACREANRVDPRIRLVLIGPPRRYSEDLGPVVRSIGMVPLERVARLVSACDIYAVTPGRTAFSETQLPTKVFDGMAMGRAIVASAISDLPRVLGKGAVMVAPGSPDETARSILRLAADEKLRRKLGKVARKIYLARWSTERMEERVVPAISRLLGEHHPTQSPR